MLLPMLCYDFYFVITEPAVKYCTVSGQKFLLPPPPRFPIRTHVKLLFGECLKHKAGFPRSLKVFESFENCIYEFKVLKVLKFCLKSLKVLEFYNFGYKIFPL